MTRISVTRSCLPFKASAALMLVVILGFAPTGPTMAQDGSETSGEAAENEVMPKEGPVDYVSGEGDFRIVWPSGCAAVHTHLLDSDVDNGLPPEAETVFYVSCDRDGEKGEGCSVTVWLTARGADGGDPGPSDVVYRVRKVLANYGVTIIDQKAVTKRLDEDWVIEGVDVLAASDGGEGQVWVRGLLSGLDMYVLTAWNNDGTIVEDPEYQNFFQSFHPSSE